MALDHPLNDRDRHRLHEPPARYAAMPFQQFKEQAPFERFDAETYREDCWNNHSIVSDGDPGTEKEL